MKKKPKKLPSIKDLTKSANKRGKGKTSQPTGKSEKRSVKRPETQKQETPEQRARREFKADQLAIKKEREQERKKQERLQSLNEWKAKEAERLDKITASKELSRAKLHALAQQNYTLRKKLAKATDETEKSKLRSKIIKVNVEKEIINSRSGIKSRRSSLEILASERGEKATGIKTRFSFRNMKSAKKNVNNYLKAGATSINGKEANPLEILSEVDNLLLTMDAYKEVRIVFNKDTGELNVWIEQDEDEEEEDGEE